MTAQNLLDSIQNLISEGKIKPETPVSLVYSNGVTDINDWTYTAPISQNAKDVRGNTNSLQVISDLFNPRFN